MKKIEISIEISVSPEKVLNAFTDIELLKEWWGVERGLIEDREKGTFSLLWGVSNSGIQYLMTGCIELFIPSRILYLRNLLYFNPEREILGPLNLFIEVKDTGGKTLLQISEDGFGESKDWDWYYNEVKKAWPEVLENLKNYLEKKFLKESEVKREEILDNKNWNETDSISKEIPAKSDQNIRVKPYEGKIKIKDLDTIVDKIITEEKSDEIVVKKSIDQKLPEKESDRLAYDKSDASKAESSGKTVAKSTDKIEMDKARSDKKIINEKSQSAEVYAKESSKRKLDEQVWEKDLQNEDKPLDKTSPVVKEPEKVFKDKLVVQDKKSGGGKKKKLLKIKGGKEKEKIDITNNETPEKKEDHHNNAEPRVHKITWADENVLIRKADFYEADILTSIAHASKRMWNYPEEFIRIWKNELTVTPLFIETNPVYCAEHEKDIIGFYALSSNEFEYELEHLWIKPENIKMGVGSKLFDHAIEFIAVNGGGILNIVTDPHAEIFYLKKGAILVGSKPSKPDGRKLPHLQYYVK